MSKMIDKYGIRSESESSVRNILWYNILIVNGMGLKTMALGLEIKGNMQNIKAVRLARLVFCWMWRRIDFQVSNWSTVATEVLRSASWIFNLCSCMGSCMQKGPILGLMLYYVLKSLIILSKLLIFIPHWTSLNYSAGSERYYSPGCGIDEENEFCSHEKKKGGQVQIWLFARLWTLCWTFG